MGIHVVIQPETGWDAEVVPSPSGVRQLVVGDEDATFVFQVPARIGALVDTARFARNLAIAAAAFGEWCDLQNRTRAFPEHD
ncbi:hypothetical protein HFP15_28270 [Amycolatopsis sp. K13G38]|uniref:Uncharacterized protein n=1 Tax=Amycolatopsis acididurans TaxID=2724524 RepID=A0ABX1JAR2_9PSEU|nr:hypothetical protein [Amycolatopsis acididurans]NKQ56774.1 hypothetical protein [Amycolatopsis acididurans]